MRFHGLAILVATLVPSCLLPGDTEGIGPDVQAGGSGGFGGHGDGGSGGHAEGGAGGDDQSCGADFVDIGGTCIPEAEACGAARNDCTEFLVPANSLAACVEGECGWECVGGYHSDSGTPPTYCVPNDTLTSCGLVGEDCLASSPEHGSATCDGVECVFTCNPGYHLISSVCLDDTTTVSCGPAALNCEDDTLNPLPRFARPFCDGLRCGWECNANAEPDNVDLPLRCLLVDGEECNDNDHCTNTCTGGICSAFGGPGEPCDSYDDYDCVALCEEATCSLFGDGFVCISNDECFSACITNACSEFSNSGEPCDVGDQEDCSPAHQCIIDVCRLVDGQVCSSDIDCVNECIFGQCSNQHHVDQPCEEDTDCIGTCTEDTCDPYANGVSCTSNSDCINSCVWSECTDQGRTGGFCDFDDNADCVENHICIDGKCLRMSGAECDTNSQCAQTCLAGTCAAPSDMYGVCDIDDAEDCSIGSCAQETCVPIGLLDASFGDLGVVSYNHYPSSQISSESARGMAIRPDGTIITAGFVYHGDQERQYALLCAFDESGNLEAGFGVQGCSTPEVGDERDVIVLSVTLGPYGSIYATGYSQSGAHGDSLVVLRFTSDGSLDSDFGENGWVLHTNPECWGYDIAVDSLGRVLVAGQSENESGYSLAIWRFTSDGVPDASFGVGGFVTQTGTAGGNRDSGLSLAIDSLERLVVVGGSDRETTGTDAVIWRFNEDGSLDGSFADVGFVAYSITPAYPNCYNRGVVIDEHDGIIATGTAGDADFWYDLGVWRFDSSGSIDTSWGGTGYVVHEHTAGGSRNTQSSAVIFDPVGNVVVAGSSDSPSSSLDMVVWRFKPDGTLDSSFGDGSGFVVHDGASESQKTDRAYDIAIDNLGRIVVAGHGTDIDGFDDIAIWRFE